MKFTEFISLFREGKVGAKSHMKNLIEMAMVDGSFDDVEYELLTKIAKKHNISESQLKEIQKNMEGIPFEVPENKEDRFSQLYDLVNMMTIDDYINKDEEYLCVVFARKFGFDKDPHGLIDSMKDNIMNGQSEQDTYKRLEWMVV